MTYNNLRKGRFTQSGLVYHITTITKNQQPYFQSFNTGRKVVQQMMRLDNYGFSKTLCYVLMPDHLRWLFILQKDSLAALMQLLKGRSARAIGYPVWQENYYEHALRTDENIRHTARYIIANPLRKKLVANIGDYPLWDAIWLDQTLSSDLLWAALSG
jgi:putative transposase